MLCISLSHRLAPVEVRQSLAMNEDEIKAFLELVGISAVVLSTCNRVEFYFDCGLGKLSYAENKIFDFKKCNIDKKYLCIYEGSEAILHLFRVACGLDSAVLGEDEILGQLKTAFYLSQKYIDTGFEINTIFKNAITCAKRIKTETLVSKTALSLGTLAASFVFEHKAQRVLIIGGTGYIGNIIMKNIACDRNIEITATIRAHRGKISAFGEGINTILFEQRYLAANEADIIISATKSPHYIFTASELKRALDSSKKHIFVDLAVPRDIDYDITELDNVELYDIDYFNTIKNNNEKIKLHELDKADLITRQMADETEKELFFHSLISRLDYFSEKIEQMGGKRLIYSVRDEMSCGEFKRFAEILEKL